MKMIFEVLTGNTPNTLLLGFFKNDKTKFQKTDSQKTLKTDAPQDTAHQPQKYVLAAYRSHPNSGLRLYKLYRSHGSTGFFG